MIRTCEEHEGVFVYEGTTVCPVCDLVKECDSLEGQLNEARRERDEFEAEVDELAGEVEELREKVENLQRQILTNELNKLERGET